MQTTRGRNVEVIAGDPVAIDARATQISELAEDMLSAAVVLRGIGDGSIRGKGYAMDKIREVVEDSHKDLKEAGERYQPAGTVLGRYADALSTAQQQMSTIVSDCEDSLSALSTRQTAAADAQSDFNSHTTALAWNPPAPDAEDASTRESDRLEQAAASAATALAQAREAHDANLGRFDTVYDSWESAYETAVNDLEDANKIGEDSTWENIAGVIAVIAEILSWVGLGLAVLGLIIGGPFIAALAVIVAVVSLVLTVALMFDGRKGIGDLLWSVVGILPIGKLGMLFKKGGQLKFLGEIGKGITKPFQQIRGLNNLQFAPRSGWRADWLPKFDAFAGRVSGVKMTGPFSLTGMLDRLVGGTNRSFTIAFTNAVNSAPKQAMGTQLLSQLPTALQNVVGGAPTAFEQAFNVYKWIDRGISVTGGRPSGALSPAGAINGVF
ncbi:putative T7SS-secreted protein [Microbacterium sp. NPDC087591]|uniref:putative T7SS-secreted protein n=1 Tax=Microbacterium sp. NPDC087591 TaxID=3364192 RepID=UPI003811AEC2